MSTQPGQAHSPSTEAYDRGQKLDVYKAQGSIAEVWLVDSERRRVTVWYRSREPGDAVWRAAEYIGSARLASPYLGAEIGLDELYGDIEL